jgi:SagB-type dehydrogenase family enzyme
VIPPRVRLPSACALVAVIVAVGTAACGRSVEAEEMRRRSMKGEMTGETIVPKTILLQERALPEPRRVGEISLEEALERRRSVRAFADTPLTEAEIGQLLWAAQGVTDDAGHRTAPSAGALYPLELYVGTPDGLFHYDPALHGLTLHAPGDPRPAMQEAGLYQDALGDAPAIFAIAAVQKRTAVKYGARAPRYVHMEAGHAGQNILLEAVALGLAAVPMGAFDDARLSEALALPEDQRPLYLIPVGRAATEPPP